MQQREIEAFLPEKETKSYENGMRQGGVLWECGLM